MDGWVGGWKLKLIQWLLNTVRERGEKTRKRRKNRGKESERAIQKGDLEKKEFKMQKFRAQIDT